MLAGVEIYTVQKRDRSIIKDLTVMGRFERFDGVKKEEEKRNLR